MDEARSEFYGTTMILMSRIAAALERQNELVDGVSLLNDRLNNIQGHMERQNDLLEEISGRLGDISAALLPSPPSGWRTLIEEERLTDNP